MLKKITGLILSIFITAIAMTVLQHYFVETAEKSGNLSDGFFPDFLRSVIIVIVMVVLPFLIIFRLLLKTHRIGTIYQSCIIGIVSALLMSGFQLLVPFRLNIDYWRVLVVLLPGFLFPLIVHIFELGLHSKKERDIKKLK